MTDSALRAGKLAALGTLTGVLLSGPFALLMVNVTHPQPPWRDARLFASSYHPIQLLPFAGGLLLVASLVLLMVSLYALAQREHKVRVATAQIFTAVFAVEMWGYAFLGVGTWLAAPVFRGGRVAHATTWAFVANGPVSIAGAVWTAAVPRWVQTPAGLAAFSGWNLLVAVMAILALLSFRRWAANHADFAARGGPPAEAAPPHSKPPESRPSFGWSRGCNTVEQEPLT